MLSFRDVAPCELW